MQREIARPVALRAKAAGDSEVLAELQTGNGFEVLELSGTNAWGVAPDAGLVGYIDASVLAAPGQ